ncbi:aminopeptidase P family protein [Aureivirga sp. CE67]|uniref:aminopeptidase P family protein n=1 Tax=Aureivirga sp. CE67 TaxID=1788983 RepID=UPI0018CA02F3|nr:aminopeptidase P family protein [Aureivirga sp. CE67]
MKIFYALSLCILVYTFSFAQNRNFDKDYLSNEFHKERREAVRKMLPENSVAVFFTNPIRNRSNDVDYVYHQNPDFYYLTGHQEPNAVLVIFSEKQANGEDEIIFVEKRDPRHEQWNGPMLGVEGAKNKLGFNYATTGAQFMEGAVDFKKYDKVLFFNFEDDYRNHRDKPADLYKLIESFKTQLITENLPTDGVKFHSGIDASSLTGIMDKLRGVKQKEELRLLKKAIEISAIGQIEVMKAMHPGMTEREVQGIHEFVYKKYGSEYEGYPSIVGAGNNGCVLHYIENSKTKIEGELILMDLGAEYHGYTADVTRTIPVNGKFTKEQKAIYDIVYDAQTAGIAEAKAGNSFWAPNMAARKVINEGLAKLGIISSPSANHNYLPHGTSHHLGLDVHDRGGYGALEKNMVITVEPGIYIPEGSPCDEKWWGIAVRIEDDILITDGEPINLSEMAPRKSEDIEKLMSEKSPLDDFKLPELPTK